MFLGLAIIMICFTLLFPKRCELGISAWLENVAFQLTETGKEMMRELEMTANQLLMAARKNEKASLSREMLQDLDIKFVPSFPEI